MTVAVRLSGAGRVSPGARVGSLPLMHEPSDLILAR